MVASRCPRRLAAVFRWVAYIWLSVDQAAGRLQQEKKAGTDRSVLPIGVLVQADGQKTLIPTDRLNNISGINSTPLKSMPRPILSSVGGDNLSIHPSTVPNELPLYLTHAVGISHYDHHPARQEPRLYPVIWDPRTWSYWSNTSGRVLIRPRASMCIKKALGLVGERFSTGC